MRGVLLAAGCGSGGPAKDAGADVASGQRGAHDSAVEAIADGGGNATGGDAAVEVRDSGTDVSPPDGAGRRTDGGSDAPPWRPCEVGSRWFDFSFPVAAAAYSRTLDLIVVLPSTERSVHIVDPETCSDKKVNLHRLGLSVSIAPSGRTAAVGEDGEVSIVDLTLAQPVASYPVTHPASEVAFDAKARVHVYTRATGGVSIPLLSLDSTTGRITTAATSVDSGGHLRMTPDGKALFGVFYGSYGSGFTRVDPETDKPVNPVSGVSLCQDVFPTDDSAHLVTGCATVLDIDSSATSSIPTARGAIDGVSLLQHLDSLVSHGVIVSIGRTDLLGSPNGADAAGFVRVHTADTYDYVKRIDLPPLVTGNLMETPLGRWVFVRSDGSRYYVLARRGGPQWGPLADGIARLDAAATGQPVTTPIPVPEPVDHDVLPPSAVAPISAVRLPFDVVDVGYSRSLDRLVVATSSPSSGVQLVDPTTGAAEPLATLAAPSKVYVRADGAVAAVVRSGGVTFLDLQTGVVLRDYAMPASQVAFGSSSEALVGMTGSSAISWLDFGTGTTRAAFSGGLGAPAFATMPATQIFYTATSSNLSYPLARHDDVATTTDPSTDLTMFTPDNNVTPKCGNRIWTSDDGTNLILDCGRVYRLSPTRAQDLMYAGGLEGVVAVTDAAYDGTSGRFFVLPGSYYAGDTYFSEPSVITVHDADSLVTRALIDLAPASTAAGGHIYPRRVFVGAVPNRVHVVAAAGDLSPLGAALLTIDVSSL